MREVTGELFLDSYHLNDPNRGNKGMKTATDWEVHQIMKMKFVPRAECT